MAPFIKRCNFSTSDAKLPILGVAVAVIEQTRGSRAPLKVYVVKPLQFGGVDGWMDGWMGETLVGILCFYVRSQKSISGAHHRYSTRVKCAKGDGKVRFPTHPRATPASYESLAEIFIRSA